MRDTCKDDGDGNDFTELARYDCSEDVKMTTEIAEASETRSLLTYASRLHNGMRKVKNAVKRELVGDTLEIRELIKTSMTYFAPQ